VQFPLTLGLRRSRFLCWLTILLHGLAAGSVWVLPWPAAARVLLLGLVALSAWHVLRPGRVTGLRLGERGELDLLCPGGRCLAMVVQPDTTVFSRLIVLRLRDDQGRLRSLAILPDSLPPEQFRVLCLWLRWLVNPGDQTGSAV